MLDNNSFTCSLATTITFATLESTTAIAPTTILPNAQAASFSSSASIAVAIGAVGVLIALVLFIVLSRRRQNRSRNRNQIDPVDLRQQISFVNPTVGDDMFQKAVTKFNPIFNGDYAEETTFNPLYDEPAAMSIQPVVYNKPCPPGISADGDDENFDFGTTAATKNSSQERKPSKYNSELLAMAVAKFEHEAHESFSFDSNQSGYLDVGYDENDDGADDDGDASALSRFGDPSLK